MLKEVLLNTPETKIIRSPEQAEDDVKLAGVAPSVARSWMPNGLSGKLLLLTVLFVMIAEILIFVPSIANFRLIWLREHIHTAEAVSLVFEETQSIDLPRKIQDELLRATQAEAIALRASGVAKLIAIDTMPSDVARHIYLDDERMSGPFSSIMDAFDTLIYGGDRAIRVVAALKHREGNIELVMKDGPLRAAMLNYARNVMLLSLVISLITAFLVFLSIRWLLIRPIQKMTQNMMDFSNDPENTARIISPSSRNDEIGMAESKLAGMQSELQTTLQNQKHLANLGLAVSKINHDLRNILASAQLFSDRLIALPDPTVQRLAPKLLRTIDRAISYTQSVLSYGKAVEAAPERRLVLLKRIIDDVVELLTLDRSSNVSFINSVPEEFEIDVDSEQLFRVLLNLGRNGLQAMEGDPNAEQISRLKISAAKNGSTVSIFVSDTGPGVSERAKQNLFEAFSGSTRAGGTGLGLAIAAEIVRAHGGGISLSRSSGSGAIFEILLPDQPVEPDKIQPLKSVS